MNGQTLNKNVNLIYLFEFLKNLLFFGSVAMLFYLDWAKLDYTRSFILEAAFALEVVLLDIPTGVIADKFGRKVSLISGGLFSGLGFLLFGLVNNYAVFFIANFICAVGMALFSGADRAILFDTLLQYGKEKESRSFFSRSDAFGTIGMLAAFPIGSLLAGSRLFQYPNGLPVTFILSGLSCFLAGISSIFIKEPRRHEKITSPVKEGLNGFLYLFRHPGMRLYSFNFALISAVTFFIYWFYQKITVLAGFPVGWNGIFGAGFNLIGMALLFNSSRLEKLFGLKALIFFSALIPGILYISMGFSFLPVLIIPAISGIAGLKQLRAPLLSDLMNKLIESRNRATVLSGVSTLEKLIMFLLYPFIGLVADKSLHLTMVVLGSITLAFLFFSRIPEKHADL